MFPPIPSWTSLHPLIIHMPIAFGLIAPGTWLLYLVFQKKEEFKYFTWALTGLAMGFSFLAVASGESTAELAMRSDAINSLLEKHEELAELTRGLLCGSMLILVFFHVFNYVKNNIKRKYEIFISWFFKIVILCLLSASALAISWTGHYGGQLVHKEGVHVEF